MSEEGFRGGRGDAICDTPMQDGDLTPLRLRILEGYMSPSCIGVEQIMNVPHRGVPSGSHGIPSGRKVSLGALTPSGGVALYTNIPKSQVAEKLTTRRVPRYRGVGGFVCAV